MTGDHHIEQLETQLAELDCRSDAREISEIVNVLNELAWLLSDKDGRRAYALSERAGALVETVNDGSPLFQSALANSLRTRGYINHRLGDFPLAMRQLLEAQPVFEALSLDDGLADVYDAIAGIYGQIGDYPDALHFMYRQLEVAQRAGDERRIANAYNNLAAFYAMTGDFERANALLGQNLKAALENGDKRIECLSYLNLVENYLRIGEPLKALEYSLHALPVCREAGYATFEVHALHYLGKTYHQLGDINQALRYLELAQAFSYRIESEVGELMILPDIAQVYRSMGEMDLALEYLHKSVDAAEALDMKQDLSTAHRLLSECFEDRADFPRALHHYKKYQTIKELIHGEKADQRMKVLQIAHDTDMARKEATLAQQKNQQLEQEVGERIRAEARLQRQLAFIRAVSECSQTLMSSIQQESDIRPLLEKSLRPLLAPAGASAVFITKNFLDAELGPCLYELVEVCAPGVEPLFTGDPARMHMQTVLKPYIENVKVDEEPAQSVFTPWSIFPVDVYARLSAGEPVGGPIRDLFVESPELVDIYLGEHLFSIQFIPLHIGGKFWGMIGLDDRVQERIWTEDEILLLGTAAEVVENTLQRWQAEGDLRTANDRLEQDVHARTVELSDTIVALHKEISEREQAEAKIQQMVETLEQRVAARTDELTTFFDLILLAGQASEPLEVIEQALPRILEVSRSQAVCIHLVDANGTRLWLYAQQNLAGDEQARLEAVETPPGFKSWLAVPNEPLVTRHLGQMAFLPPALLLPGYRTYLGVQIRIGNRVEGVMSCYRLEDQGYGLDDIALAMALSEQIGMMLENHRLRQDAEAVAVMEERHRLARDLHDSVSQSLYSLSLFSRVGREAAQDGDMARLESSLAEMERNTLAALREMRLLLYQLRPAGLHQGGLIEAVELRLNMVEKRVGLKVDLDYDPNLKVPWDIETELYHIIIEAMNNVVKHGAATRIGLQIYNENGSLNLSIADDGQGFDIAQSNGGMGLDNIRERVDRLNGDLSITSKPGEGTQLKATIPCP